MVATIYFMVKISQEQHGPIIFNQKSSYRIAILVYKIPPINFVILALNLVVTLISNITDTTLNTILAMANMLVFAMPLVCVPVIAVYFSSIRPEPSLQNESLLTYRTIILTKTVLTRSDSQMTN